MLLKSLKSLYNKIINVGAHNIDNLGEQSRIRIMNYWLLLSSIIVILSMTIGGFIDFYSYFLPSSMTLVIILLSFYLSSIGKHIIGWRLVQTIPALVITFLPAFTQVVASSLIFFIVFQSIVFIFFTKRKILFSFLVFYGICAIIYCYFMFGSYTDEQNYNDDLLLNVVNLIFGLLLQFNALYLLQEQREKGQANLRENEAKFRSIFEDNPLGILLSDGVDFSRKEINQMYHEMLGYTKEEVKTMKISDFTYEEDKNAHNPHFQKLLKGETRFAEFEKRYIRKDKSIFWAKTFVALARDRTGKPIYNIAMLQDISQTKEQEIRIQELLEDLKHLNAELEQKVEERTANLSKINEELHQSNQDLEQFAYIASHDLQEPLRMVGNFVQLLERRYSSKIDDSGKEYIKFAVEGVTRMSALIKGLLEYSRVGRKEAGFKPVNLNNILAAKIFDINPLLKETKAEIIADDLPKQMICEPIQLGVVFYNLIVNGIKFNNKEAIKVIIKTKEDDQFYHFSISDNGIGIKEEYQHRVFEIFKRLNNRDAYEGNGIGLALCKKIVLRHGGKIWYKSEINKGTTFHFTISKDLSMV